MNDEEFRKFVYENKEKILNIMAEAIPTEKQIDAATEKIENATSKISGYKDKAEDVVREAYDAVTAPEVRTHFIRMGMEFFFGLSELIERMPAPGPVKRVKDDITAMESEIRKQSCATNPDCSKRKTDLEKIELD